MGDHWYAQDGSSAYTIRGANGNERAVTLRDARKYGYVPSVTTVLQVIAKPNLEDWKVDQGILSALTLPRIKDEREKDYLRRVKQDSKQQTIAASDEGTRIHDAIETGFKGGERAVPEAYIRHYRAVRKRLADLFPGVTDWIAERSFAHDAGFGGKVDLHSPSTGITVDYKGKDGELWQDAQHAYAVAYVDGERTDKRCDYDQHYQLGAYNEGLLLPRSPCANIFVSRTHPGQVCHRVWTREEVQDGIDVFYAALELWKRLKKYNPAVVTARAA
jgi:hypothetical protein